ncbi:MAG TPA: nucleotide exchange factor GrpE [Chthonomonadaceae bacterium]|nr:nucleotide exchange factor GrpE [Chthonomonadaceae bacterium]
MRRKIMVNTDEPLAADGAPDLAPDAQAPEFGDHPIPPEAPAPAEDAPPADETGARDYITALQSELEEMRTRAEEAEKRILYVQAEFQNYRRRKEEEQAGLQKYNNSELIKALLPIIDNFERALAAAEQTRNFDALVGGVSGTLKQLRAFLEKAGVKPIESVGKEFDPNFHEAIGHTDSDEYPANTVAEEVQKGYVMHDRVLRPSLVKVSQGG